MRRRHFSRDEPLFPLFLTFPIQCRTGVFGGPPRRQWSDLAKGRGQSVGQGERRYPARLRPTLADAEPEAVGHARQQSAAAGRTSACA